MSSIILSPGFGAAFPGDFAQRIDPVLIGYVDALLDLSDTKANRTARKNLLNRMVKRFSEFGIETSTWHCEGFSIAEVPSGSRFTIEEYDGAEYIVAERDLIYTAP